MRDRNFESNGILSKKRISAKIKKVKEKKDFKKVNKTRKSRGYFFEKVQIVQAFNSHKSGEWCAKRLGGSTTHLPDVVVTNNSKSILYSIEAKSGDTDRLYIPRDEIERCIDITDKWLSSFQRRYVVLAFKFKRNKTLKRKLQYRFIISDNIQKLITKELKFISYNISKDELALQYEHNRIRIRNKDLNIKPIDTLEKFVEWDGWTVTL